MIKHRPFLAIIIALAVLALAGSPSLLPESPNHSPKPSVAPAQNGQEQNRPEVAPAQVTEVIDGDTIRVLIAGKAEKVRLIGVDAPEATTKIEPYGYAATRFTKTQLLGKKVYLEFDAQERDKYGRLLAYVWMSPPSDAGEQAIREHMFNSRLLLQGYAQVMTVPPNVKYASYFQKFSAQAREARRGLWKRS
ncbi:MAG: thermonuclease family protein [Clostridia bacterium]|nr:thermonuclease family protein [Clostridia bacterium]